MKRPEQELQQQAVRFIRLAYPGLIFWHTANQVGNRTMREMGILKAMGQRAGVADLTFILPHGIAAFMEFKAGSGKLTSAQQIFRADVEKHGCLYAEVRSLEEVQDVLWRWLNPFGWVAKARAA